jgi:hypothetical protein
MQKISPPPDFETRTVQSAASRNTDYAIPACKGRQYMENLDVAGGIDMKIDLI